MKKISFLVLGLVLIVGALGAGTIANIVSHKGMILTLDKGSQDGVQVGQKGIVKAVYKDPSGEYDVNIGLFVIRETADRTSQASVESMGSGFKIEDARFVVFDQNLKPAGQGTTVTTVAPAKESVESYLDQGDAAFEEKKYQTALTFYQKVLGIDSQNMIAKEKAAETEKRIKNLASQAKFSDYLKKADQSYRKNDFKFTFLYLVEALRAFPDGREEVRNRLQVMAREHPRETTDIVNEKSAEISDIRDQIDPMLAAVEGSKETVKPVQKPEVQVDIGDKTQPKPKGKAERVYQNEAGNWEAVFVGNLVLVFVPEGEFTVGSPEGEGEVDEHPAHRVYLDGYWMGKNEVTFAQYDQFCQETGREKPLDGGWGRGELPVINVSWEDAQAYCRWLTKKTGLAFRLPTEAEWEKAAHDLFPWGDDNPSGRLVNFNSELARTAAVGSYPGGRSFYGLLDMAGNVWEWLGDWYGEGYYGVSAQRNPRGPGSGTERVVRGGCWASDPPQIRSANRSSEKPTSKLNVLGFRVAL